LRKLEPQGSIQETVMEHWLQQGRRAAMIRLRPILEQLTSEPALRLRSELLKRA